MDPKKRRRALLLALFSAPALGAVAWRLSRPPVTPADAGAAGPELAMPAPPRMSETPRPSSLTMVRGDRKPPDSGAAKSAPAPDVLVPVVLPKAPAQAPAQAAPAAPQPWRPRHLLTLINWRQRLFGNEDQNAAPPPRAPVPPNPPPSPPQEEKKAAPPPPPAPPPAAPTPPPAAPKPPPVIRHAGPLPGSANTEITPTTQVSPADPPPQGEVSASLTPADPQPQTVDVHFITHGKPDTPPPPDPIPAGGAGSACLVAGAFENTWTGVCYPTRDACSAAEPRGQCVQPPGVKRKAGPQ